MKRENLERANAIGKQLDFIEKFMQEPVVRLTFASKGTSTWMTRTYLEKNMGIQKVTFEPIYSVATVMFKEALQQRKEELEEELSTL